MKRIFCLLLALVVVGSAVPVYARSVSRDAAAAGNHLSEVIDLVMNNYVGGNVSVDELLEAAIRGMTEVLDPYSNYLSANELEDFINFLDGRLVGIGVSMETQDDGRIKIDRVFEYSPAEEAGLLAGDIFVSVNGDSVVGLSMADLRAIILDPDTTYVYVGVERNGQVITFNITKAEFSSPTVTVRRLEAIPEAQGMASLDNFRYMRISSVGYATGEEVRNAISTMRAEGVQGIILDLRGNSGGHLDVTVDIANQLVPAGVVLQMVNRAGRRRTYSSVLQEVPFNNVVVLVNRFTASAAEVIASALQDSGAAVVIGEPTYGKGSVQSFHAIGTGGALSLTTEEYFRRGGGRINGVGVEPCIPVTRTFGTHSDNVLQAGLEVLIQRD